MFCLIDENDKILQLQPNEVDGFIECPDDAVVGMLWDGTTLSTPVVDKTVDNVLSAIDLAMYTRINQGIKWAWSAEEDQNEILLNAGMREILSSWHQLLTQPTPQPMPHGGFIRSNGVVFKAPGNNDIPDVAIIEIANFAGLWVSKISRIRIVQETAAGNMTQQQRNDFNASTINWAVTWNAQNHPDWIDDLVLYNP